MKIELEPEDIESMARRVVDLVRPLICGSRPPAAEDTIFTPGTLAEYLRVQPSWVYKKVASGSIPYFRNGKYLRFRRSAIEKWMETQSIRPFNP